MLIITVSLPLSAGDWMLGGGGEFGGSKIFNAGKNGGPVLFEFLRGGGGWIFWGAGAEDFLTVIFNC